MKILNIKIILLLMVIFPITALSNDIDSAVTRLYPNKNFKYLEIGIPELKTLISKRLDESPELSAVRARIRSSENQLKSLEASMLPTFNATAGYSYYRSRHRDQIVNKRVPVKWDNDNPIISNIQLPNGGQGIIWLPRPLAWDYRDIPVIASIDYSDRSFRSDMGISYKLPFGLVISPFSYSLDYRFAPKTYGLPWTGTISTSLMMPLFKNFGWYGASEHVELEVNQLSKEISDVSLKMQFNNIVYSMLSGYFSLYFENAKLELMKDLEKNLVIQAGDVDLLNSEGRITVTEKINTEANQRNSRYEAEYTANRIVFYSTMLNTENIDADNIVVFKSRKINDSLIVNNIRGIFSKLINNDGIKKLIDTHPGVSISEMNLKQSEISLKFAENQDRPDISLSGSVQTYEGPQYNLGYNSPGTALWKSMSDPDGIFWNIGLQYKLPTGNPDKYNLITAEAQLDAGRNDLKSAKKSISDRLKQHIFNINNSLEAVRNAENNLAMVIEIHDKEALPLFESKRLNRFDYYSYKNQVIQAKISLMSARAQYITDFINFSADMQIDWNEISGIIE